MLAALVALNALLVVALVNRFTPARTAQAAPVSINASAVLAVPGTLPGISNGVIFLLDTSTNLLAVVSYDSPTQKLQWTKPLDLNKQLNAAGPVRRP